MKYSEERREAILRKLLPHFQGTPLWEASLWAKGFRRSVAERVGLPQGPTGGGRAGRVGREPERIP